MRAAQLARLNEQQKRRRELQERIRLLEERAEG
jgi:hypothetical protein